MNIRIAIDKDILLLKNLDPHISESELISSINLNRIIIAEIGGELMGWLRWNLFWDNIHFMTMLFFLEPHRNKGYGRKLVEYWENRMKEENYTFVLTSSQSEETAQHFYRKLNYTDCGSLLFQPNPLRLFF